MDFNSIDLIGTLSVGQGKTGPVGPMGPPGRDGVDGTVSFDQLTPDQVASLRGPQGFKGEKGDTGDQGPIGLTGPQGIQGIKGDKGETGAQGPRGFEGPRGLQGIQGEQGEKGDPGQDGEGDKIKSIKITTPHTHDGITDHYNNGTDLSISKGSIQQNHARAHEPLEIGDKVIGMTQLDNGKGAKLTLEVVDTEGSDYKFRILGMADFGHQNLNDYYTKDDINNNFLNKNEVNTKLSDFITFVSYNSQPDRHDGAIYIGDKFVIEWKTITRGSIQSGGWAKDIFLDHIGTLLTWTTSVDLHDNWGFDYTVSQTKLLERNHARNKIRVAVEKGGTAIKLIAFGTKIGTYI